MINEQDIARIARELCDEENQQLHVSPWSRHRRFRIPAWVTVIPAAAIVGFLLGIWTNTHMSPETPMTALVDTVYVKVKETIPPRDTAQSSPLPQTKSVSARQVRTKWRGTPENNRMKSSQQTPVMPTGQPILSDKIRYDLLVTN